MKKIIRLTALALSLVLLLCACGSVSPEDLKVPTFEDDRSMVIGTWTGSLSNFTDEQFDYLKTASINLLLGVSEHVYLSDALLDKAEAAGMEIISDSRQWNGQVPGFIDHPAFRGYCVWDEPASTDFEALAEKKALWDSTMGDKTFFVNLFPGWAGNALGGSFKSYVSSYLETVKPEVLCFDHYPLMMDANGNTVLRDSFFSDMDICSYYAKQSNVPFWFTLLTSGHLNYVVPNAKELRWQMAVGQAYGVEGLVHYTYASHDPDYTSPIDWNSQQPTELYNSMMMADSEVAAWDHIYMNYDWQGTATVTGSSNPLGSTAFQLCQFSVDPTENTAIKAIDSTEDLLCGIFKDANGGEAYMLTNATNPAEGKDTTVKLTLDSQYKGVLLIDCGRQSTRVLRKNAVTIEIGSSKGIFVIPLTAK